MAPNAPPVKTRVQVSCIEHLYECAHVHTTLNAHYMKKSFLQQHNYFLFECLTEISISFMFVCVWQEPFSTVDESNLIPFVLLKPVPRCAKFPITTNENMQKGEIGQDETEAGKENTSTQNQENAHFSRGLCRCLCSSLCLIFCRTSVCSVQKV
jgi:hypothetical protein